MTKSKFVMDYVGKRKHNCKRKKNNLIYGS
jgi:hypothetical protein